MHLNQPTQQIVELQQELWLLLQEFDRICRNHQISYQLAAGTLLGAVRHQGFIPWDDDLDVCMTRQEYQRFLQVASIEAGQEFFLQHKLTDPNFPHFYSKFRLRHSKFNMENGMHPSQLHGAFMDIFPFDSVDTHSLAGQLRFELFRWIQGVYLGPVVKLNIQKEGYRQRSLPKKIQLIAATALHVIIGSQRLELWLQALLHHATALNSPQLTCLVISVMPRKKRYTLIRQQTQFNTLIRLNFCGKDFPAPANYHQVLTHLYGDYLSYPPPERQVPSHGMQRYTTQTPDPKTEPVCTSRSD